MSFYLGKYRLSDIKKQEWWLIRHAPVHLDYLYGQRDVDADYSADKKFSNLASIIPCDALFLSSDLQRCVKTTQKIVSWQENPDQNIRRESAFREQNFGDWQGLTYDQIEELNEPAYRQFWDDPAFQVPSGGESFHDLSNRVIAARQDVTLNATQDKVCLVAHAGTIRAILSDALKIPLTQALSLVIDPLSYTKLTLYKSGQTESWQIDWINRD